jgi:uncharacterized membrane protein
MIAKLSLATIKDVPKLSLETRANNTLNLITSGLFAKNLSAWTARGVFAAWRRFARHHHQELAEFLQGSSG